MTAIAEPLTQDPLWTRARAMFARAVANVGAPAAIAAIALLSKLVRRDIVGWLYPLESIVRRLLIAEAAELHRAELARTARGPRIQRVPLRSLGLARHVSTQVKRPSSQREEGREEGRTTGRALCDLRTPQRPLPLPPPPGAGDARAKRIDLSRPETWRARFSFALPRNPRLVPNARAPRILDLWRDYSPPPPRTPRIVRAEDAPFRLARRFEALRHVLENPLPHAERLARVLAREVRRYSAVVRRAVLAGPRTDAYDPADPRLSLDALGVAWDAPQVFAPNSS